VTPPVVAAASGSKDEVEDAVAVVALRINRCRAPRVEDLRPQADVVDQ
jgi:hypothetical protein